MRANMWELLVLKLEFEKYYLFIYDTVKSIFKQRLEVKVPVRKILFIIASEDLRVTCVALPKNGKDDEYIAVGGTISNVSPNYVGAAGDFHFFPFVSIYRRNVAQTIYQDYAMTIIRSKTSSTVRKLELLPKTPNGWMYLLAILDASLSLVRFKDKKFQIVGQNDQFVFNPCFVYGINNKYQIITTDANRKFYMINCKVK